MTYTLAQLCERWQCSHSHVLNLIRSGALVAINIGTGARSRYVVTSESLKDFEQRRTVSPPTPTPKRRAKVRRSDVIQFFK
jgi:hypothetical protein